MFENAHLGLLPYRPPVYTNVQTGLFFECPLEHAHDFGMHIALPVSKNMSSLMAFEMLLTMPANSTDGFNSSTMYGPSAPRPFQRKIKKKMNTKSLLLVRKKIARWVSLVVFLIQTFHLLHLLSKQGCRFAGFRPIR